MIGGADPTTRCPACGHDNRVGARFCDGCGVVGQFELTHYRLRDPGCARLRELWHELAAVRALL